MFSPKEPQSEKPWCKKCREHTAYQEKIHSQRTSNRHAVTSVSYHCKVCDNDINNYREHLNTLLDGINVSNDILYCKDVNCKYDSHVTPINDLCSSLIDACLNADTTCIPKVSPPDKRLPGWNEHVEPLRQDSLFWHAVWISCGRPPTGALANLMRFTRAKYHRAVKDIKREKEKNRYNCMETAFQNNENRQLWSEIKRMQKKNKVK